MATHPDQSSIDHIRSALWRRGIHGSYGGCAVMIGAGMSLNAIPRVQSVRGFPDWNRLMQPIIDRLYPSHSFEDDQINRERVRAGATSAALRLAEEFAIAFGENDLEALLREQIPDSDYQPSALHQQLLRLPWADVFTTNWDTLLERCANDHYPGTYATVLSTADLPLAQRPRIVKLHGTLGTVPPCILTESHFRDYPRRFAPFVNTVRQSIMENVLCLIGFSGDDPNFLEWSGWVRDQMGDNAPPIYLISLGTIRPSQRALLTRRRIVPIDLSQVYPEGTHDKAARSLEWFLYNLTAGQPADPRNWPNQKSPGLSGVGKLPSYLRDAVYDLYDADNSVVARQ